MTFYPISSNLLLKAAEDAEKRGQYGLIIWSSKLKWRNIHRFVNIDDALLFQIADALQNENEKMCWVGFAKKEVALEPKRDYVLVISTSMILSSRDYLNKVLRNSPLGSVVPISTLPSNHLSAIHLNTSLA